MELPALVASGSALILDENISCWRSSDASVGRLLKLAIPSKEGVADLESLIKLPGKTTFS